MDRSLETTTWKATRCICLILNSILFLCVCEKLCRPNANKIDQLNCNNWWHFNHPPGGSPHLLFFPGYFHCNPHKVLLIQPYVGKHPHRRNVTSYRFFFTSSAFMQRCKNIHSKSDKVCGLCFSVSKNLRKKCVNCDKEFGVNGAFF